MRKSLQIACLSAALAALVLPAAAQNANTTPPQSPTAVSPTPPIQKPPTINQRENHQQDRIAQGVRSGQLTAGETARLEDRESAINHEVRADRAANGGKLTPQERARVNHQLNRTSRAIYRDKHNAARR